MWRKNLALREWFQVQQVDETRNQRSASITTLQTIKKLISPLNQLRSIFYKLCDVVSVLLVLFGTEFTLKLVENRRGSGNFEGMERM